MKNLTSVKTKKKKRVGRGLSAGQGKTAGRGTKGQKSRSGYNIPKRFEGGQSPLSLRLPKLPGFKSHHAKAEVLTLDKISKNFKDGDTISIETLTQKGIFKKTVKKVKILNTGALTVKVTVSPEIKISESISSLFSGEAVEKKPAKKSEEKKEEKKAVETKPEAEVKKAPKPKMEKVDKPVAKPAPKKTPAKKK